MADVIDVAPGAVARADEVQRSAAEMFEFIASFGADNDAAGAIAPPVVDRLFDAGVFRTLVPEELGGVEATPRQAMDIYRTLAYADPSTGWVAMAIALATGLAAAFVDRATAEELLSDPRLAIAGQGTRAGKAVPVEGGYRLTGQWQFASGIKHSTHLHTAAADTQTGEVRFFLLPVEEVAFDENWDVLGLRGTGSIDYSLEDVFVPTRMSYPSLSREPQTGGWVYRVGIGNFASVNHGAWALGVGRRLLDELSAFVRSRASAPGALAQSTAFHQQFAQAELRLRSAQALLYTAWEQIEQRLARGESMGIELETLNRAALCNATDALDEVSGFVYRSATTTALRAGTLQQLYRDVHGGTQHISSSPMILQSCGQQFAGLAEGKVWSHFSLV